MANVTKRKFPPPPSIYPYKKYSFLTVTHSYRFCRGTGPSHLLSISLPVLPTLKVKAICSSEMPVLVYQITLCHISRHSHHCEHIKSLLVTLKSNSDIIAGTWQLLMNPNPEITCAEQEYLLCQLCFWCLATHGQVKKIFCLIWKNVPITVAARSKARTVFARSNTEMLGSNPT
jgi:hypothetical protein